MVREFRDLQAIALLMLQWSHVFSDMVREQVGAGSGGGDLASMEPCLFRHGKRPCEASISTQSSAGLQWSHVFSDMVSSRKISFRSAPTDASMEPCLFRHGKALAWHSE
ncbi:hypothetical protein BN140_3074 [Methanoculleus bourgensis MS2]|uniref:Uncharacterized protein n=2 Tax=Methanoculleus bourgensis TaxID=83986 RepID=W6PPS3_METBM|nr:hypothetical protein BN140_3074 [Methanoculleus bourgensis MS2]CVK34518.1 protein of unknown function [Methanoculleus bourgensis]